ncbi:MAG: hypothetical protein AB1813_27385 [Verrucomicrobiota bacterium]|jgi:chromosome segregation ATPase
MPDRARVTSVEALDAFRAHLIVYVSKARPALEEVNADVLRTRLWLQNEQRMFWEGQVRRRTKKLEEAQQALFSARVSNLHEAIIVEQMAVQKARRALEEAEGKLQLLKKWHREFDSRVEPLLKQLEKLHTILSNDMPKAAAYLAQAAKTLSDYAGSPPPSHIADSTRTRSTEDETAAAAGSPAPTANAGSEPSPSGSVEEQR